MAIPPFVNGVLPSGTYAATLREVLVAFVQASSSTRPALDTALQHAAALIWSRDATAILYVNGSYVTAAVDPVDVDVAVRSDMWDDTTFAAAFSAAYPGAIGFVDIYFNPKQSVQHMEDLFREVQGSSAKKGIIQLLP